MSTPTYQNPLKDKDGNAVYLLHIRGESLLLLKLVSKPETLKIGVLRYDGTLVCHRPEAKHFYFTVPGWAFNAEVFEHYRDFGITHVRLVADFREMNEACTVQRLIQNFLPMPQYTMQGYERQMLVLESFFERLRDERLGKILPPGTPPPLPRGQLKLF